MALSQIFLLIVALFLFAIMCILMSALFESQCEDFAKTLRKVHDYNNKRK